MQLSDGYIDLPAGKIANVQTCLEMLQRPAPRPDAAGLACTLDRVREPDLDWYRSMFRAVGAPYLWFSRLTLTDAELRAIVHDPCAEIYTMRCGGVDEGLLELDFCKPGECELKFLGLTQRFVGKGAGRWMMNRAIDIAWSHPIHRFWVHTCSLDHPDALSFYMRSGFVPFKRQIEIADDPRLTGTLPRDVAPHVPIL